MNWKALRDSLKTRSEVAAVCRRHGYDTIEELLGAADAGAADELVAVLVADGPVGVEVALAVLVPELKRRTLRGHVPRGGEDVGQLMVAACWERLQRGSLPARPSRSVVEQARKTVVRDLQRAWRIAKVTTVLEHEHPREDGDGPYHAGSRGLPADVYSETSVEDKVLERMAEADLINWVMTTAGIDDQTARIIVHSRALGVSMEAVAASEGLAYHTAFRRRERAEKKLRSSCSSRAVRADHYLTMGPIRELTTV